MTAFAVPASSIPRTMRIVSNCPGPRSMKSPTKIARPVGMAPGAQVIPVAEFPQKRGQLVRMAVNVTDDVVVHLPALSGTMSL